MWRESQARAEAADGGLGEGRRWEDVVDRRVERDVRAERGAGLSGQQNHRSKHGRLGTQEAA